MPNFLSDYLLFNEGNEANQTYHIWSALAALSSIASRRFWIDQGYFKIYANLYVVLVGPPGNKKTTSMQIAKGLVRELGVIPFSGECQTKESLVKEMSTYQQTYELKGSNKPIIYTPLSCFVTELSQFIGVDPARMIDFLVTIYDSDYYDCKTKNKGNDLIHGPYLTVLACTTPDWITNYLRTDVITGGFSRRAIFVNEISDGRRISFPEVTPAQREAWERCMARARQLLCLGGRFEWSPEAHSFYDEWYTTRVIDSNPNIASWDSTMYVQVLKITMLLTLSEGDELVIKLETLQAGIAILEKIKLNLIGVFQGMGRNELNRVRAKVLQILAGAQGPMSERKLKQIMFSEATAQEQDSIYQHMLRSGEIVALEQKKTTPQGELRVLWYGLPGMTQECFNKIKEKQNECKPNTDATRPT